MKIKMLITIRIADATPDLPQRQLVKGIIYDDLSGFIKSIVLLKGYGINIIDEKVVVKKEIIVDEKKSINENDYENKIIKISENKNDKQNKQARKLKNK